MSITNTIEFNYEFNDEDKVETASCTVEAVVNEPIVTIAKVASPSKVSIGDVVTYRVDIVISDGDPIGGKQTIKDILDDRMELVVGTLKLDGELLEEQDLSRIEVEFEANSNHYLEYQCVRVS